VYDLLLRKIEGDLENNNIETLVFVLDGSLRNIPMAALHDGKQYLIEKYAVALSPSLQLLAPKPLARERLEALAAGFAKASPSLGLPALTNVPKELERIKSLLSGVRLLDREFTTQTLKKNINSRPFSIVHLATHGKFGSQVEDTYILTGDGDRINVNQLGSLLQTREQSRPEPIELLTLSACETAEGNKRAALGMAGVAIRSGARSTLATLWSVNDESTTDIMSQFYELLVKNPKITKAKALQSAQVALLRQGKPPFHWSPYVLIGNWL
jgi:CHAT domain-containing protein